MCRMRHLGLGLVWLLGVLALSPAHAAEPAAPDQVVRHATDRLLEVIGEARGYYDQDPQRYFRQIGDILDPMVDFERMARGVMGNWGTRSYYQSLPSDAQRAALLQQADQFAGVFRASLIETYGKGVLAFSGERIEVLPVPAAEAAGNRVTVMQRIHGNNTQPLVIRYFLERRSPAEPWRLINVLIGDVNIGALYRSQFANAMNRYQGNLQQVIDTWTVSGPPAVNSQG